MIGNLTRFESNVIGDLAGGDVNLNGVIRMDQRIGIADGATVVCDQVWNLLGSDLNALHFAQLVLEIDRILLVDVRLLTKKMFSPKMLLSWL